MASNISWQVVQAQFQKRWRTRVVLSLLGLSVVGVATLAITESEPDHGKRSSESTSRALDESPTPDLSSAGYRVGSLAVSLVNDLLSESQSLSENLITAVPQISSTPNSTTTTTIAPTTTTIAPTTTTTRAPVSDEPTEESFEPEQEAEIIVFGQPYLASWPSLEMWERMAWCESRQTWDIDTGNGYFGGLQFALGSWQWMGGEGSPSDATKEEQIYRANLLWQAQGWNGWPGCKQYFGWSRWQVRE